MSDHSNNIKLTFLVDNNPGPVCGGEHGLSILVEADQTILFDTGQSQLFIENSTRLGLNINSVSTVVLSHGHYDHGNGLKHFTGRRLICHPNSFTRRFRDKDSGYIGLKFDKAFASNNFELVLSEQSLKISRQITFLGAIPRANSFEAGRTTFSDENGLPDYVPDDSALVINTEKGLVIISGCAHSGICNIIEYARVVSGQSRVRAVIGGFHLKEGDRAIEPTVEYLKKLEANCFLPCHCVDEEVMKVLHQQLHCESVFSGKSICFPCIGE